MAISDLWLIIDILLILYWLAVSALVIAEDRDPTAALAWLLVLIALPIVGLVIYFFFGRNWPMIAHRSKKTQDVRSTARQFMEPYYAHYADVLPRLEARHPESWIRHDANLIAKLAGAPPLTVRSCDLHTDGDEYFDLLIADLAGAERFIHISYFIWKDDVLTDRITDVLVDRLKAGVEVRVLNDWFGSAPYSRRTMKRLREAGAIVRFDMTGISKLNLPQPPQDHRGGCRDRAHRRLQRRPGVHRRRQAVPGLAGYRAAPHRPRGGGPGEALRRPLAGG
nr:PLDc N-terminal domain-containing protein [Gordonia sp. (in: high G+C Gram-positive bacteria)]